MSRGRKKTQSLHDRFWSKVERGAPGDCWPWQGTHSAGGYGLFGLGKHAWEDEPLFLKAPAEQLAPRIAFILHHRVLPGKLCVLHTCDNPPCVNPAHLYAGTRADNMRDCLRARRHHPCPSGAANPNTHLTAEDVLDIRRRHAAGDDRAAIAGDHGISLSGLHRIVNREVWTSAPGPRAIKRKSGPKPGMTGLLDLAQVEAIRTAYASGHPSLVVLGLRFGVSKSTIHNVVAGRYVPRRS